MRLRYVLMIIVCMGCNFFSGTMPLPDEALLTPDANPGYFPGDLTCRSIHNFDLGPGWQNITIGKTMLAELRTELTRYGYEELSPQRSDFNFGAENPPQGMPDSIDGCVDNGIVTVLAFSFMRSPVYLTDLVSAYGKPDTVTWTDWLQTRAVFWFEQGIAAEVDIDSLQLFSLIYYPYQSVDNYEQTYPFNQTRAVAPLTDEAADLRQNPFGFSDAK